MKLISLKKQLELIFSRATLKAFYFPKPVIFEASKLGQYQTKISHDVYNSYRQKQFKEIEDSVTAVSIANQIKDLIDHPNKEFEIWVDAFGSIQVRLRDALLENYINKTLTENKFIPYMTETFQKSNISIPVSTHKMIFPIVDILQQISLVHYRHWICLQSIARVREYFNEKVKRTSVVSNNLPFHGIVFKYMKQHPGEPATMNNIVLYLQKSGITDEQKILSIGIQTLSKLKDDQEMFEVYQQITKQKFLQLGELFDFGRTERLKSRQLNKHMPLQIVLELAKDNEINNHVCCQRHQLVEMESIRNQKKLNLNIHKIGEINDGQNPVEGFLTKIDAAIKERLQQNIPQFIGKAQKSHRKWINYPIITIPPEQYLSINPKQVADMMFSCFVQMISLHDLTERAEKMTPTSFKIVNETDRKIALTAIDIINQLDNNNMAGAHSLAQKLSEMVRAKPTYAGTKLAHLCIQQLYELSCLT